MRWYPRKKGLVNGIIVGGFGMGAFIFNTVQTSYLNPLNLSPEDHGYFSVGQNEILQRVPSVFLLLGSIYTAIQLVAVILISRPTEDEVAGNIPLQTEVEINMRPGDIVRTREFWTLWFTFVLNTQAVGYINTMYKAFGQTFIKDDHFLAVVGAFAAIFNSGGRVLWGHLCDVFGYKSCMLMVTSLISLLFSTLYFTEFGQKATFAIWVWAIFFSFCGNFVLLPTATALCFGTRHSSKNYGLVMTGSAAAAPLIAVLTQYLNPVIGFLGMFIIIAVFSAVAAIITFQFPSCPSRL